MTKEEMKIFEILLRKASDKGILFMTDLKEIKFDFIGFRKCTKFFFRTTDQKSQIERIIERSKLTYNSHGESDD